MKSDYFFDLNFLRCQLVLFFSSETVAKSGGPTLISAVSWKLEYIGILDSDIERGVVHQVIRNLIQPPWTLQSIILVIVKVILKT